MPPAARVGDQTAHGGQVGPPGAPTVLIVGQPAANVTSQHIGKACPSYSGAKPCETAFSPATAVPTVLIGGAQALVMGSTAMPACAAAILVGAPSVLIGG